MPALAEQISRACRTKPWGRFQVHGVRFLTKAHPMGRGKILGDDQGLGKTYQTAVYLKLHPVMRPAIIVCQATMKYTWERELWRHTRTEATVLDGTKPYKPEGDVWIINFDILHYWLAFLIALKPALLIIDECQKVKNRRAKRTKAVLAIAKKAVKTIGLSGTPITRGPIDFFPILHMVAPKVFPSFHHFAFRYCDPKKGFAGHWEFNGVTNVEELHTKIAPFLLRRTKEEVLPELPKAVRTVIPVKIDLREYKTARDSFIDWLIKNKGAQAGKRAANAETIVRLGHLKRLAAEGKLKAVIEWLQDWRDDNKGKKMVVLAYHKSIVHQLVAAFPRNVFVTGEVTGIKRQQAIDAFQSDPRVEWLFGNLEAAGTGLTLTAAAVTVTVELAWVPTTHDQADDRINRIGQTAKHLDNIYFIAKGTIEEHIWEVLETRRDIIAQVVDGKAAGAVQNLVIEKLLQEKQ